MILNTLFLNKIIILSDIALGLMVVASSMSGF